MNKINWPTVLGVGAVLLVTFMTWGALGGWSGMGPSMMGSVFDGMVLLGLVFIGFFVLLFFWVVWEMSKKNYPTSPNSHPALQICPECGDKVPYAHFCPNCGAPLP